MASHEINLEYKYKKLTQADVQQIVGANQQWGGDEIIIRCLTSTRGARQAAATFTAQGLRVTIIEGETPPKKS
jgi:hypothetical protein